MMATWSFFVIKKGFISEIVLRSGRQPYAPGAFRVVMVLQVSIFLAHRGSGDGTGSLKGDELGWVFHPLA